MGEEAYPKNHPAHPDNRGKKLPPQFSDRVHDYASDSPQRTGQGQSIPTDAGSTRPRDGFRHLYGFHNFSLAEAQRRFDALSPVHQHLRRQWNEFGYPSGTDEFCHLHGVAGDTLEKRQAAFEKLPEDERAARMEFHAIFLPEEPGPVPEEPEGEEKTNA